MPATSSLARLQRAIVLGLLLAACAWAVAWWPQHPWVAAAGVAACLFGHAVVLALEFVLLLATWGDDPTPRPTAREVVGAWWRESCQGLRVFGWRQPFRWRAEPDWLPAGSRARGIVFVHGFVCNRGFWAPWLRRCRAEGIPHVAVNLEPVHGPIDDYAATVEAAVRQVAEATGRAPVLVCHSMGGLAARAWMRRHGGEGRVAHVVTLGTPHHGTWLARFSHLPNGRQMRPRGEWLDGLGAHGSLVPAAFTCWYANADNIVFPPATATLRGADNRLVRGAAHVDLAFRPQVIGETLALVRAL